MSGSSLRRLLQLGGLLLLAAGFYAISPPEAGVASAIYLHRARSVLGEIPPGAGEPTYPSSTAWVAYPLAGLQEIGYHLAGEEGETRAAYLARTERGWRRFLRGEWCLLGGLAVWVAAALAAALAGVLGVGRSGSRFAAALSGGTLLLAPAVPLAISGLSAGLPAGLMLLLATRRLELSSPSMGRSSVPDAGVGRDSRGPGRPSRGEIGAGAGAGLILGLILAWAAYAWIAAALFLLLAAIRRWPAVRTGTALGVAVLAGLALEPRHLIHPAGIVSAIGFEWVREGGLPLARDAATGHGLVSFLLLAGYVGPVCGPASLAAVYGSIRRRAWPAGAWLAGLWASFVLLPGLEGLRLPGALQLALVPLLAAAAGAGIVALGGAGATAREDAGEVDPRRRERTARTTRGRRLLPVTLAALLLLSLLHLRLGFWSRGTSTANLGRLMADEIGEIVGPDTPWLAERPLPGGVAAPGRSFLLPRDSRDPDRYDFAYWPRWYAGFGYVLVSSVQLRQNLNRPDADVPRYFYGRLQTDGRDVRDWGRDRRSGEPLFRLVALPEDSRWRAALSDSELAGIRPNPELSSFLSQLGSVYAESGRLRTAARLFERGIRLDPAAAPLYNNLGSVYLMEDEVDEAGKVFEQGLHQNPRSPELLYNAGRAHARSGSQARAEQLLRRAVAARPDFPEAHYELARVFLAQGKMRLARMALEKVLELQPGTPRRPEIESVLARLAAAPGRPAGPESSAGSSPELAASGSDSTTGSPPATVEGGPDSVSTEADSP